MKSHTGAAMVLGKVLVYGVSSKHKLNMKIPTEGELVGVDDASPLMFWTGYYLEARGWAMKENVAFQDNQSAMLLEQNCKSSSSKRTHHINIRYFLSRIGFSPRSYL